MQTKMLDADTPGTRDRAIAEAARFLREGEVVAFPTETVYGLGADAMNPDAIGRVFRAKGRPSDNPLIVHLADATWLFRCGRPEGAMITRVEALAAAFMPGPLTLVLPADPAIPAIARAGLPTVALRVPAHPVANALLVLAGPLVAPSANLSGRPSPTTAQHVLDDLGGGIAAVLDGGACRIGIESTVVDLSGERPILLRPGTIGAREIEEVLGGPLGPPQPDGSPPRSPGMKYRHYAPAARVRLIDSRAELDALNTTHILVLTTPRHLHTMPAAGVRPLHARTLYALFREADAAGIRDIVIYAEPGELEAGLLDRIMKAAQR